MQHCTQTLLTLLTTAIYHLLHNFTYLFVHCLMTVFKEVLLLSFTCWVLIYPLPHCHLVNYFLHNFEPNTFCQNDHFWSYYLHLYHKKTKQNKTGLILKPNAFGNPAQKEEIYYLYEQMCRLCLFGYYAEIVVLSH